MFAYCGNNPARYSDPSGHTEKNSIRNQFDQISFGYVCGGAGGGIVILGMTIWEKLVNATVHATDKFLDGAYLEVRRFSKSMREELADLSRKMPHVHHIAPVGNFSGRSPQTIQKINDIHRLFAQANINIYYDPMNLMLVSAGTHATLHTDQYIKHVHDYLMETDGSRWEIYKALFYLRLEIAAVDILANGY